MAYLKKLKRSFLANRAHTERNSQLAGQRMPFIEWKYVMMFFGGGRVNILCQFVISFRPRQETVPIIVDLGGEIIVEYQHIFLMCIGGKRLFERSTAF
jgi:hypothetical protein